ncbi:MAG TPA: hypothetical protein VJY54_13500 [Lachnospiraceae bacterium]|nr:hypothetical protein [Lachnospiraceae bacterium]
MQWKHGKATVDFYLVMQEHIKLNNPLKAIKITYGSVDPYK